MKLNEILRRDRLKAFLETLALVLLLGFSLGYVYFHSVFPHFTSPFDSRIPIWLLILILIGVGCLVALLEPDPRTLLTSAISIPVMAMFFSFILFISPSFSPSLVTYDLSENLLIMMRFLLVYMFTSFLVILLSGFFVQHLSESFLQGPNEDIFRE